MLKSSYFKRLFDIIGASILFAFTTPLSLLIIILCLALNNGFPIFYISTRLGKNGKTFRMLKFRTMIIGADKMVNHWHNRFDSEINGILKNYFDPRITRFGNIIRRLCLDELPQLINVIIGDMSLVGPRPYPIEYITYCQIDTDKRLKMKPGITGLAQVKRRTTDISTKERLKYDFEYIKNQSFRLDLILLCKTLLVIFKPNGEC